MRRRAPATPTVPPPLAIVGRVAPANGDPRRDPAGIVHGSGTPERVACLLCLVALALSVPGAARAGGWPAGRWNPEFLFGYRPDREDIALMTDLCPLVVWGQVEAIQYGSSTHIVSLESVRVLKGNRPRDGRLTFWTKNLRRALGHPTWCVNFRAGDAGIFFLEDDTQGLLSSYGEVLVVVDDHGTRRSAPSDLSPAAAESIISKRARARAIDRVLADAECIVEGTVVEAGTQTIVGEALKIRMRALLTDLEWYRGGSDSTHILIVHDRQGHAWRDQPEFREGERAMVALSPARRPEYRIHGGWQGKLERLEDGSYVVGPRAYPRKRPYWEKLHGVSRHERRRYSQSELVELIRRGKHRPPRSD